VAAAAWVDLAIEMAEGMAVAERVGLAVAAVAGAAERAVLDSVGCCEMSCISP